MNGRRILIVGDQPKVTELLTKIFRFSGWDVAPACSVAEALDRLFPPPDCLLATLALHLPDGSLYDVIRAARARSPEIRVVLLHDQSELYDEEVLRRVREQGFGLPDDGSASDEQYDDFFKAFDRTRRQILDEEIGHVVMLASPTTPTKLVRACEPA